MEIPKTGFENFEKNCQEAGYNKLEQVEILEKYCNIDTKNTYSMVETLPDDNVYLVELSEDVSEKSKKYEELNKLLQALNIEQDNFNNERIEMTEKLENGEISKEEFLEWLMSYSSEYSGNAEDGTKILEQINQISSLLWQDINEFSVNLKKYNIDVSNAQAQINSNNSLVNYTIERADDLSKNNKKMAWLGLVTLGITSIISAVRGSATESAKEAASRLDTVNKALSATLENAVSPHSPEVPDVFKHDLG